MTLNRTIGISPQQLGVISAPQYARRLAASSLDKTEIGRAEHPVVPNQTGIVVQGRCAFVSDQCAPRAVRREHPNFIAQNLRYIDVAAVIELDAVKRRMPRDIITGSLAEPSV
jgi:hypothetical protein